MKGENLMKRKIWLVFLVLVAMIAIGQTALAANYNVATIEALKTAIEETAAADDTVTITQKIEFDDTAGRGSTSPVISANKAITIKTNVSGVTIETNTVRTLIHLGGGATLDGVSIEKTTKDDNPTTDGQVNTNLITLASGSTVKHCTFRGQYGKGDNEVVRAMATYSGATGYVIDDNKIYALRQPCYLEGTGTVSNNHAEGTRGWVVCDEFGVTFTGNSFKDNAVDIALTINKNSPGRVANKYDDILDISDKNGDAYVEDQRELISSKAGKYYVEQSADLANTNQRAKLEKALTAALTSRYASTNAGAIISLGTDYDLGSTSLAITTDKKIVIETNGYTITSSLNPAITVDGTLTLKGNGKLESTAGVAIENKSINTVYIDGVAVTGSDLNAGIKCIGGQVIITNMPTPPTPAPKIEMTQATDSVTMKVAERADTAIVGDGSAVIHGTEITYYPSFETALTKIVSSSNDTVVVTDTCVITQNVTLPAGVTIDLNGHTVTANGGAINLPASGLVYIEDSAAGANGSITVTDKSNQSETITPANKVVPVDDTGKEAKAITKFAITGGNATLNVGQTKKYTTSVAPSDAAGVNVVPIWKTSSASVATIDNTGNVGAVGAGTATITATIIDPANKTTLSDTVTITVNASSTPVVPTVSTPIVTGTNALTGALGSVGKKTVKVTLSGAKFNNDKITLTATIGTITVTKDATENGEVGFDFAEADLNKLETGVHTIKVSSASNSGNYAITSTEVGTLTIGNAGLGYPGVTGPVDLGGKVKEVGKTTVTVKLENALFSSNLALKATISTYTANTTATKNGDVSFEFPATEMNALASGVYPISVTFAGNSENAAFDTKVGTLTINGPTLEIHGKNVWTEKQALVGEKTVTIGLTGATFGGSLPLTAKIGTLSKAVNATKNGEWTFTFTATELNKLTGGVYPILITSPGNTSNEPIVEGIEVGTLTVQATYMSWSIPSTFKATTGVSYQLVKFGSDGAEKPKLTIKIGKPKTVVASESDGTIRGTLQKLAKNNKTNVVVTDDRGNTQTCTVTVVANSYTRAYPLKVRGGGVFSSMKKAYYEKGALKLEIYLLNMTKRSIRNMTNLKVEIRQGDTVLMTYPVSKWKLSSDLKYNKKAIRKVTVTEKKLSGVSSKAFDLGRGEIQAVLTGAVGGTAIQPLCRLEDDVVYAKGVIPEVATIDDVQPSGLMQTMP